IFQSTVVLFKRPLLRTTVLLLIINFALAFGYYGLFMWFPELFSRIEKYGGSFCDTGNSTGNSTDCEPPSDFMYVESFLTSISNLPGNILSILIVERHGVLSGVSVFFLWLVKTNWQNVLMSCIFWGGPCLSRGFKHAGRPADGTLPNRRPESTAFGFQTEKTGSLRVGAIWAIIIFGELVDLHCAIPSCLLAVLLAFAGPGQSLAAANTTGVDIH
ncbi:unnamed protein product, partial [Candidula unifasciata]